MDTAAEQWSVADDQWSVSGHAGGQWSVADDQWSVSGHAGGQWSVADDQWLVGGHADGQWSVSGHAGGQWSVADDQWSVDGHADDQWSVSGYLSSAVAVETGVGLAACPWLVDVPPGRLVNITLVSPSARRRGAGSVGGAVAWGGCEWTVVVREGNLTTHLSGCGTSDALTTDRPYRRGPDRVVYTSRERGAAVSVHLSPTTTSRPLRSHLLLHFTGTTRRSQ